MAARRAQPMDRRIALGAVVLSRPGTADGTSVNPGFNCCRRVPMKLLRFRWFALALLAVATVASAQIKVENAWVRATVPGQQATGAFMKITSTEPVKLISVATPAANINEIHEMKMEAGVMKMRAHLGGLDIPARKVVELKSGGHHVMMMDLTQTIKPGQTVPLELQFADAKGLKRTVLVNAKTSFADPYPK